MMFKLRYLLRLKRPLNNYLQKTIAINKRKHIKIFLIKLSGTANYKVFKKIRFF